MSDNQKPAPKSAEDYQAAAMSAIRTMTSKTPAEPAFVPPSAPMKLDEKKLIIEPPVEAAQEEPQYDDAEVEAVAAKAAVKPEVKPESDSMKRSFEKLARANAQNRADEEKIKVYKETAKHLDPRQLQKLVDAMGSRDPVSLLAAAGFSHTEYSDAVVQGRKPATPVEKPKSEVELLKAELASVKARLQNDDIQAGRQRTLKQLDEIAKADTALEYVTSVEGGTQRALDVLEDYVRRNGPPLDADGKLDQEELKELYSLSLRHVDEQFKAEAEKWEKVLTKRRPASSMPVEPVEPVRATSERAAGRTLSNALSSPAPVRAGKPQPRTDEDYIASAMQALRTRAQ